MTEQDLQNKIRVALSKYGTVFRVNVGAFYTKDGRFIPSSLPRGFPDLFFISDGKISFIEVKVKPNRPTEEQLKFLERMKERGCRAGVAYSVEDALRICGVMD